MLIAVKNCEDSEEPLAWVFRFYPKIDQATKVVIYTFSKIYVPTFRAMTQRSSCKMWIINKICSVQTWDSFLFFKLIRTSLRISTREMQAIFFATFIKFNPNFHQKSLEMPKSLIISKYTKNFTSKFQFHSISRFFSQSFSSY